MQQNYLDMELEDLMLNNMIGKNKKICMVNLQQGEEDNIQNQENN